MALAPIPITLLTRFIAVPFPKEMTQGTSGKMCTSRT